MYTVSKEKGGGAIRRLTVYRILLKEYLFRGIIIIESFTRR